MASLHKDVRHSHPVWDTRQPNRHKPGTPPGTVHSFQDDAELLPDRPVPLQGKAEDHSLKGFAVSVLLPNGVGHEL